MDEDGIVHRFCKNEDNFRQKNTGSDGGRRCRLLKKRKKRKEREKRGVHEVVAGRRFLPPVYDIILQHNQYNYEKTMGID